jgi:hypothetical protein
LTVKMAFITLLLVAFAPLIGFGLGRTAALNLPQRGKERLEAISCTLSQLSKDLCGDKGIETRIKLTNEAGADLSAEELAYNGGSLNKIERAIYSLNERVGRLADAAKKESP